MPTLNLSVYRVLISAVLLFASGTASFAQLSSNCEGSNDNGNFSILIDTIATNIGVISDLGGGTTDLTGFNTYQLYLQCESPSDLLQAVGGDISKPVTILTTTSFYQADLGTALEPNAGLFGPFPQVQYDSFVTIGLESTAVTDDGEASTQLIEDSSSPVSGAFENEQDLVINSVAGSSWYIADAELASNCAAGSDLKILFAQVTTDGDIDGDIQFQVYRNGTQNGANCLRPYLQVNPLNQAGCTEISACNFDPAAFLDDGSCDFCSCADTTSVNQVSFPSDSVPGYHLDIELIANHDTTGIPELEGMKTYRFYVATAEPNDTLTAVYGNDETPLDIQSTSAFFQSSLGAATPNNIQTLFYDFDPTVIYDSWVTIGIDKRPSESGPGYSSIFTASDPNLSSSWMADFDPGSGNPGGNILANTNVGGIWSITNPTVQNGIPNEDQRVLIGQFTTSGVISGSIATQILPQTLPEGDDEYRLTFSFNTENLGTDFILVNGEPINEEECGCISDTDSDGICDSSDNCSDTDACNYDSAENGECQTLDVIDICGGDCSADEDADGICDDVDSCIGEIDACGVCNGPGETFNCGCYEQHPSWCDCFGNTTDALGVCGGDCEADNNDNGICDADEIAGCQDNSACNYNEFANVGGVDCVFATGCDTCSGATDGNGTVIDNDADNDGVCDANEVTGCTDPTACNYDDDPTTDSDQDLCTFVDGICETCEGGIIVDNDSDDDGVCDANEITGCTDPTACNYDDDPTTDSDQDLCTFVDGICETCEEGIIVDNDSDDDGVCDANEVTGCTDPTACNYDDDPTTDSDQSLCTFVDGICETCEGGVIVDNDTDNDNVCDANEVPGCQDQTACNYDANATDSDGSCTFVDGICETCEEGIIVDNDSDDDGVCDANEVTGCTDPTACNYDDDPTTDSDQDLCTFVDGICETCEGGIIVDNDSDDDGVCDANEITGCTDPTACNYDDDPTTDSDQDLCTFVDGVCETCVEGIIVDNDSDDDGVCDANEITGCTDPTACNYDDDPTTDSDQDLCTFVDGICETCEGGVIVDNDSDDDGVCDANEVTGCTDPTACNYDDDPTTDSDQDLCTFVDGICETCEGGIVVDNDSDDDGVCDANEVTGCTDPTACNYDDDPTTDSDQDLCTFVDGICETCEGGIIVDNDSDDDGVCDANEVTGCTDPTACNYDDDPTTDSDQDLCTFVDGICETCEGGVIVDNDSDDDGVCDANEITGCTDPTACNYDDDPTTDSDQDLCTFVDGICETCEGGIVVDNDSDDDGVCDANEITGCTDPTACNYDDDPTTDSDQDLCTFVDGICETCEGGVIVDNDSDDDGVCDANEVTGCTDPTACNYDDDPTTDSDQDLCTFVDGICETCEGGVIVDNDSDDDGVCDANEVTGCTDPTACNYDDDPTTDSDQDLCTFVDGICETCEGGVIVDNDSDDDGVCDANEVTGCTDPTACNYDDDPTTDSDQDLCTFVDGICETCEGGVIVDNDSDDDGVCDANEVTGCTDPTACNYDDDPTTDNDQELCTFVDGICETCEEGVIVDNDSDDDGVCDANEVTGCTDPTACNYDDDPTTDSDQDLCTFVDGICETCEDGIVVDNDSDDDGVCDANEVTGCTDPTACNYDDDPTTDSDQDLCTFVDGICDTCLNGQVIDNDQDNDGVCDADETSGCTDPAACNTGDFSDSDNSLCTYADGLCDTCVEGQVIDNDSDEDGVCDANEVTGCTDPTACNYDDDPTTDSDQDLCTFVDGICETCEGGVIVDNDTDDDGVCDANEVPGCQDQTACNYDANATDSDGSCTFVDGICETCEEGIIVDNDSDDDGVCDANEVTGCTDPTACNYDDDPTTDSDQSLCTFVDGICETCEGGVIVDNDSDDDGVCDANEVTGCTDPTACNYDDDPTTDSDQDLCTFVDGICETCEEGVIVDNDSDDDGVCDANEVTGCTDPTACNYDDDPTTDSDQDLCTFVDGICETCEGGIVVDNDSDDDGVCDANEVTGCTDPTACNYDDDPTTDSDQDLCTFVDGICETCEGGVIVDNDSDDDGVCDANEVTGCTDPTACNYDDDPTTDSDQDLCTFVDGICETCEGGVVVDNDSDDDGVCDANEVTGCTDPTACNYDDDPTTDSDQDLCTFVDGICETCEGGIVVDNDSDDDGVCDANEVTGCTDPTACNYDDDPTTDSDQDLCTFVDGICDTCLNGQVIDNDQDNDGVCDADETSGCTDPAACNTGDFSDSDNSLCTYADGLCDTCVEGQVIDNDSDDDGVCDANEVTGCTDPTACNYDDDPTTDSDQDLCTFVDGICETCEGGVIVDNDTDDDGVCDANEVTGCTDPTACNYDDDPTTDSDQNLCTFVDGICETCEGGVIVDNDSDDDGVCDANEIDGCTDNSACNFDPTATEDDGTCLYEDALGICGGICLSDLDNDGICDNEDACVGQYDALGICNGDCPADLDNDDICDNEDPCVGQYDVLGVCNGDCTADDDADGICDDVDPCVGTLDALGVCNGDCPADADEDGVCDNAEILGCTDGTACNYDSTATEEDGSCDYLDVLDVCGGSCTADEDNDGICDDVDACVGSYDALGDCNGGCTADIDDDGICDSEDPCIGSTDALGVCNGDCPADIDEDGVCDNAEVLGCDDPTACNFDETATENDGSCTTLDALNECGGDCSADADSDGICDDIDPCIGALDAIGVCNGDCAADTDGDGVCDTTEIFGCTDENACNYNAEATEEDDSCATEDAIGVCGGDCPCDQNNNGICDGDELTCPDFNDNGVCDGEEIFGCSYQGACNYDALVTADDGSCAYALPGYDCQGNDLGTSELFYGCTYSEAVNYSAAADIDNGSCIFVEVLTDIGPCYFDITNDGIVNTPDLLILLQYWEATCVE